MILVEAVGRCPIGIMAFPFRPVIVGIIGIFIMVDGGIVIVQVIAVDRDVLRGVIHGQCVHLINVHVVQSLLGGPNPIPKCPRRT